MVIPKDLERVVQSARREEAGRRGRVVDDIGKLEKRLGPMLVVRLYFPKIRNEIFEDLPPSYTATLAAMRQKCDKESLKMP